MIVPAKSPKPKDARPRPGMNEKERKAFEASFKDNEEALRRLAKL